MQKCVVILTLLFGVLFFQGLSAQTAETDSVPIVASLDEDNGIMGFSLQAHVDSCEGIRKVGKHQQLMRYKPAMEPLQAEGVDLKYCYLYFWKNRLHSIELKTKGGDNTKLLLDKIVDWYGGGEQHNMFGTNRTWTGKYIRLFFEQNLISQDGTFTYMDDEVHNDYYKFMLKRRYGQ